MKVIEIATVNHVSTEDVIKICKDLGIGCETRHGPHLQRYFSC